ncbi:hypothetical protein HPB50_023890 [Hyalomma asiaticum]|uniref:Uncharacterized protein n=1 Tax=Hyalomma asiaticum TaxID=266040 RepID=A0ACB7SKU6_HYAAI|nr:hypothetical protein HPB50_023890 [Hyalomma asiaticum]
MGQLGRKGNGGRRSAVASKDGSKPRGVEVLDKALKGRSQAAVREQGILLSSGREPHGAVGLLQHTSLLAAGRAHSEKDVF